MKYLILIDPNELSELDFALIDYFSDLKMYGIKPFLDSVEENRIRRKLKKEFGEIPISDFTEVINQIVYKKSLVYSLESDCYSDKLEILLTLINNHPAMTIYSFDF